MAAAFGYTEAMRDAVLLRRDALPAPLAGWRAVLLCLLIALLPLRGWAWSDMAVTAGVQDVHAPQRAPGALAEVGAHGGPPPCHGHNAAGASQSATPQASDTHTPPGNAPHAGCSLCDLCHAGAMPSTDAPRWSGPPPQCSAPGWHPTPDTGRQDADGPFRPPRG